MNYSDVKQIMDTLPIGFYARRRVEAELSKTSKDSYFVPLEEKIVISYPTIETALKDVKKEDSFFEVSIRSLLYHEVSHAIMTPTNMKMTQILNIFEDERIETLLKDFYYGVDFKKNLLCLTGYNGEKPTNAMQEFYQTVRFRQGDEENLEEVNNIINDYSTMTAHKYNDGWRSMSYRYIDRVYDLYNKIADKWGEQHKDSWSDKVESSDYIPDLNNSDGQDEFGQAPGKTKGQYSKELLKEIEEKIGEGAAERFAAGKTVDVIIEREMNTCYDQELTDKLNNIISSFNKKNNSGNGITAYSGVFDPRQVVRKDYRYFVKKTSVRGNNIYGSLHLNLFLDDSGSMSNNEEIINKLIYSLLCVERENTNFSFDIITCATNIEVLNKRKGYQAIGGTYLRKSIVPLYKKMQKPNTYNYNIVLFDGYADTDAYLGGNTFKVFDNNNSTIISDYSNQSNLKCVNSGGRVILSNEYTKELIDNVIKTLQQAFK